METHFLNNTGKPPREATAFNFPCRQAFGGLTSYSVLQSMHFMDSNWAAEHLQVIRTLMERAAVYRRALAPIMLSVGATGCVAGGIGFLTGIARGNRSFVILWMATAIVAIAISYLLVRRQALKEEEPFWSPPTRRVTQALVPGFLAGGMAGILLLMGGDALPPVAWLLAIAWILAYGCALHSAGFFMERGIKLFGLFIAAFGSLILVILSFVAQLQTTQTAHALMGVFFGVAHLVYGAYLRMTERKVNS